MFLPLVNTMFDSILVFVRGLSITLGRIIDMPSLFMAKFQVTEVPFDYLDIKPSLEDEFTMTAVTRQLASIDDPKKLKSVAVNLLALTMQRQAIIRSLCKKLAESESVKSITTNYDGK
tara:strand:+ start:3585 stop:3938 length:354 start_codon:yes stop_codon:yes gene_type:complete